MRILVLFALLCSASGYAQNLLGHERWQAWNAPLVLHFSSGPEWLSLLPYDPNRGRCGIEQIVDVPVAGTYQFHFQGAGGVTGWFGAEWDIGPHQRRFWSESRQFSWTVSLSAGPQLVRFTTDTSDMKIDAWIMRQPILRPVVEPTVEVSLVGQPMPSFSVATRGHMLLLAMRRLSVPLSIPGLRHGLELDPEAGLMLLAISPTGNLTLGGYPTFPALGPFYLQAIDLDAPASFGSRLYVSPFSFAW